MRILKVLFLLTFFLIACQSKEKKARLFIQKHTDEVAPIAKELNLTYWEATAKGTEELYKKQAELELKLRKIYTRKDEFEMVKNLMESKDIKDPYIKRQLQLLYLSYFGNQIDEKMLERIVKLSSEIEGKFNTYRAEFEGKRVPDNTLSEILKEEKNLQRRKNAWEASKQVGEVVSKDLIELVKLRNEAARSLGFSNYYEMELYLSEQKVEEILNIFDKLAEVAEPHFIKIKDYIDENFAKKYKIKKEDLRPYHYQDFFFQEVQAVGDVNMDDYLKDKDVKKIVENFYNHIGLPVSEMLQRSDLYEREGKYQHAYCIDIDREGDVRTMCSIRNNRYWLETLMHELGHGVYSMNIDRNLPWLLREEAHIFTTEAIAELFGALPTNPLWLIEFADMPVEVVEKWRPTLEMERKMGLLIFCMWSEVMVHFEKALYENPDQDLNTLWWDLVEKYQKVKRVEGRDKPDWAAKIHLVSSPVYYHNYMLGNLMASQLFYNMAKKVDVEKPFMISFKTNPELGNYLKEKIFYPGKLYRWDELIVKATGEPLNPEYFAKEVSTN
ncbi:MAG: M2 family metallopeptidase [Thermoanaerobaculia bacterium]